MILRSDEPTIYLGERNMGHFAAAETALVFLWLLVTGLGPVLTILSINALFALSIPITVFTWLAIMWLSLTFSGLIKLGVQSSKG
jgi:hypothetical protein